MSTFTKEQLIEKLQHRISVASGFPESEKAQMDLELARIALASLEAEAVTVNDDMAYAFHHALSDSSLGADEAEEIKAGLRAAFANVTAPTAPVAVPEGYRLQPISEYDAMCAAMLQGAENAESRCTIKTAPPLDSLTKNAESRCGNSPVIQDGWVLVPEEPTHEMLEAGDEQFGTYDMYRRMIAASPQQK
ncbi:hypothetical protein [Enterobacter cloacae complex sp. IR5437]|uniref:hypothetical protein n=1 Tax=Enterobacter cloacae complex sp. IR5437 TaxID=3412369 RepID=UPI003B9F49C4